MKKTYLLLIALVLTIAAGAQTLNVRVGSVTYLFPASQTNEMTFSDGTTLTIMGKTFTISDIDAMTIDYTSVTDDAIGVNYDGSSATITVAGNIAQYVTPTVSGAHVAIEQSDNLADEITYTLRGSSTDGEFYMSGSYKATIELNGLTLTNASPVHSGSAVHIQNGKRIKVKVVTGTTNSLTDAANGSQKGCLYINGHAEFAQQGTLNIIGKTKHGIKTGDYMTLKNATINITSAVKDGINCNEYLLIESGTINISNAGDEGIQCELDGETSTGETTDHEDEDSGNIYIEGGTLIVNASGEGIESKGEMIVTGGEVCVTAKDDAINSGGDMTISGGSVYAYSTGNDGIDANGNCYIKGGLVYAIGSREPEVAIDANSEQQKKLYITGGTIVAIGGLESGAELTQSCYAANSWSQNTWYALTVGNDTFAFQTPASGGNTLVVSGASEPILTSGVTVSSGTKIFNGAGYTEATVTGGSSVSLSSYTGGNGPGGGPGGGGPGGGPGGGWW